MYSFTNLKKVLLLKKIKIERYGDNEIIEQSNVSQ